MPINSKYVFVASMDVDLDKEDLFNEVYDTEHIPNLLNVSGVHSATRVKGEPFALSIGGGKTNIPHEGARYSAVYEIDGPHVLVSPEWAKAGRPAAGQLRCARTRAIGGTPCTRSFSLRQVRRRHEQDGLHGQIRALLVRSVTVQCGSGHGGQQTSGSYRGRPSTLTLLALIHS
jgi:hypothetical protein